MTSVISASDYGALPHASPGSIVEVYGTNLDNHTRIWTSQDFTGPNGVHAPTVLDGVAVTFNDQPGSSPTSAGRRSMSRSRPASSPGPRK